jgi:hypothetical protein
MSTDDESTLPKDELAARLTAMANAAGVAEMSQAELQGYQTALEERLLESGEPLAVRSVHAIRRVRERARSGDRRPFGVLFAEEMRREDDAG